VSQVQQQIQVLAADSATSRSSRASSPRRERLAPTATRWPRRTKPACSTCKASWPPRRKPPRPPTRGCTSCRTRCRNWTKSAAAQQAVNTESGRQADLSPAWRPSRRCRKRCKTDGKLKPWLAKHGLDGLQGLWSRIHIEPGWENALEAALRERLGALEVSRLDMVRAFAADAPPAKLAFYSPPPAGVPEATGALPRLADLLRLNDAGAEGPAGRLAARLLHRPQPGRGPGRARPAAARRSDLRASGHAVTAHSVSFYAPDSEQAGLLARAQEIENLDKQLRAQALITTKPAPRWCAPRPPMPTPRSAWWPARREASEAQSRAHELQVETLRLTQLAEQTRARSEQIAADLAEVDAQLEDLQERRVTAEARFEELDMQLADSQERHAQLDERVIEAERKLAECREQQRSLERQAQEAELPSAAWRRAAPSWPRH
jgi:chromosome segregation protein